MLVELAIEAKRAKYAGVPAEWIPKPKYSDSKNPGLIKCIHDFLTFKGFAPMAKDTQIKPVATRKGITYMRVPINSPGDITATIKGHPVIIKANANGHTLNDEHQQFRIRAEAAGIVFLVVRSFQEFFQWYHSLDDAAPHEIAFEKSLTPNTRRNDTTESRATVPHW